MGEIATGHELSKDSDTVALSTDNNEPLLMPAKLGIDRARQLILPLIPAAKAFFDHIATVDTSFDIELRRDAHPLLIIHGDHTGAVGPFINFIAKDSSYEFFDILSFSIDISSPSAVFRSRDGGEGGGTRIEAEEIQLWFADSIKQERLINFFNQRLNRRPQETKGRYPTADAEVSLVGFSNPLGTHYPHPVIPVIATPRGLAFQSLDSRGGDVQYTPISSRNSFVALAEGVRYSEFSFNTENELIFAISPTQLIFYDRSLTSMFCRAICLGAWRDGGRDGLAGVTWLSGMGGDIGLHLRALQDKYRLWTKDVLSEERRALDEMAYQFNERRLVEDCFPAEEVALIPATLQELLTLNKFPDFKPFDQYKYPLISIGKDQGEQEEQGSFILRWPDDFR